MNASGGSFDEREHNATLLIIPSDVAGEEQHLDEEKQSMISPNSYEALQATAALYALGALSQHEARAFESRLNAEGRELAHEVAAFDAVIATLALSATEQTPPAAARQKLLAGIAAEAGPPLERAPQRVAQFINLRAAEGPWVEIGPGLQAKRLFVDRANGTVTTLLKLAPGAATPRHRHTAPEQCYILEGDFQANELRLAPGDFHVALPGSVHETIRSQTGALVLIVAPENYELL